MDGSVQLAEMGIMQADMDIVGEARFHTPALTSHPEAVRTPERGWHARLALEYGAGPGGTRLLKRAHQGPLTVQKALYPEGPGVCHTLILHPPSGIVGGDRLEFDIGLQSGAQALITMPGATRWYRSADAEAVQKIDIRIARDSVLEWLPPETIIFNQAKAHLQSHVALEHGARYTGWEILCLGRTAAGEKFTDGLMRQHTEITIGNEPVWDERLRLAGNAPLMRSVVGLGEAPVSATLLAAGVKVPAEIVARCREHVVQGGARAGVSAFDAMFVARYVGASSEQAREYFVALWRELRPLMAGREAVTPRIWTT